MKLSRLLLVSSALIAMNLATKASACSLVNLSSADIKSRMIAQIIKATKVKATDITPADVTEPKLDFIVPLQGDCSGLYSALHASAFEFTVEHEDYTCVFNGVTVLLGYGLDGPISVQAYRRCEFR